MTSRIAFLGGISGIGKSFAAKRWAEKARQLDVVAFSELMLRHLPGIQDHRAIVSTTSPEERAAARRLAIADLGEVQKPTLVTGHYGICTFSRGGGVQAVETAFPGELLPVVTALMLADHEDLAVVLDRRRTPKNPGALAEVEFERTVEGAIFTYLAAVSGKPAATVGLDRPDSGAAAVGFLQEQWPDIMNAV